MRRERLTEYGWLYLAKLSALAANVLLYRFASEKLGVEGFAEYSLARRGIALLLPVLLAGQLVALPRSIALDMDVVTRRQSAFLTSQLIVFAITALLVLVILIAPTHLASWIFGDGAMIGLLWPMAILMVAQGMFYLVIAYYQGMLAFKEYGLIGLVCGGLAPIAGFWIAAPSTRTVLFGIAVMTLAIGGAMGLRIFVKHGWPRLRELPLRDLLEYGVPRIPGDFAMGGMLGLPSMLVANRIGLVEGGYVAFCGTMMSMVVTAVAPISTAWLPRFTQLASRGEGHTMSGTVVRTLAVVVGGVVLATFSAYFAMPWLTQWYLGEEFAPAVPVFKVFSLGLVPFAIYGCLRSIVDAAYRKPINTVNIVISLATFYGLEMILNGLIPPIWAVIWSALASYVLLALLTIACSWRPLKPGFRLEDRRV